jgi:hypothetical protein
MGAMPLLPAKINRSAEPVANGGFNRLAKAMVSGVKKSILDSPFLVLRTMTCAGAHPRQYPRPLARQAYCDNPGVSGKNRTRPLFMAQLQMHFFCLQNKT